MPIWKDRIAPALRGLLSFEGLSAADGESLPTPSPVSVPSWPPPPAGPVNRTPVRDERFVPPTQSFAGRYPESSIRNTIRGAGEAGIDPNLFLSMALQEGYLKAPPEGVSDRDMASLGRHLRETAGYAARTGEPSLERLIQSYNGLGSPAASFQSEGVQTAYGGQDVEDLPPNFYGHRVLDVMKNTIGKSPAIQELIRTTTYQPRLEPLDMNEIEAISADLDRQRRQPYVSAVLRNPNAWSE